MTRRTLALAAATLWLGAWPAAAQPPAATSGTQYAFLVACQDYDGLQLRKLLFPVNDVLGFRDALVTSGYAQQNVVVLHDGYKGAPAVTKARILAELTTLLSRLGPNDSLVMALSGHGVQFKDDATPYFCPADADLKAKPKDGLLSIDAVFDQLKTCHARRKLLLVDACRDEPLAGPAKGLPRAADLATKTRPLAARDVSKGTAVLYSCDEGQQSYELPGLHHGIFFHNVIREWQRAGVNLTDFCDRVTDATKAEAAGKFANAQSPVFRGEVSDAKKWVLHHAHVARKGYERPPRFLNSVGMTFVRLDGGEFAMGGDELPAEVARAFSESELAESFTNEQPRHLATVAKRFYLSAFETTNEQFLRFVTETNHRTDCEAGGGSGMSFNPNAGKFNERSEVKRKTWRTAMSDLEADRGKHPVVLVSWNDAQAFCAWLSEKEGRTYRLPTEQEWEYAARAGTQTRYWVGNDPERLVTAANVPDESFARQYPKDTSYRTLKGDDGYSGTAPVGSFRASPFELYDMHGNVWEWCQDGYFADAYARRIKSRAPFPASPERVMRGGCFM